MLPRHHEALDESDGRHESGPGCDCRGSALHRCSYGKYDGVLGSLGEYGSGGFWTDSCMFFFSFFFFPTWVTSIRWAGAGIADIGDLAWTG